LGAAGRRRKEGKGPKERVGKFLARNSDVGENYRRP